MSRILADAKPAPPRVGCVLLRSRLGARGRDGSNAPLGEGERRSLVEELAVIAGGVAPDTVAPEVFFVDPSDKSEQYGGFDGWARCVKGYLNARGYAATVAVAPDRDRALEAARSRWGTVVVIPMGDSPSAPPSVRGSTALARETTAVGLAAPRLGHAKPANNQTPHRPARPAVAGGQPGQLGLPGLILGRPKRRRKAKPEVRRAGAA